MPSSAGDDARAAPSSKGKATMAADEAAQGVACGICLTDSRRAIRGELDCCAHHFCFVCIMAWARVESRCPFCKARFRTIRRPPVPGRLPSERIVTVAQRIQVFYTAAQSFNHFLSSIISCQRRRLTPWI
jgi:PHD and RING finger domain-containing protein 1